jgi:hypothetical protein
MWSTYSMWSSFTRPIQKGALHAAKYDDTQHQILRHIILCRDAYMQIASIQIGV